MGQEISQQSKICNNHNTNNHNSNIHNNFKRRQAQNSATANCNEKFTKHKQPDPIYAPTSHSSTSSASSTTTDDVHYRQRQKYNLHKQAFEKTKVAKKFSLLSNNSATSNTTTSSSLSSSSSSSAISTNTLTGPGDTNLKLHIKINSYNTQPDQRQRRNSQSTDSGIYYSSCYCSSSAASSVSLVSSSGVSTTSGCSTSVSSQKSHKSLDKQKQYLSHHLYIKSYLDILEEDEKARANYKPARPGGIRNYTPKILAETPVTISKPATPIQNPALITGNSKQDPWI